MAWTFGLTDLDGVAIGEIQNAYERKLTLPLNGLPTASFRLRLDDPLVDEIASRDGDCLVKVYQGSSLRFIGDVMDTEEVGTGEGATLAVNAAGPLWRLQKRLMGTPGGTQSSWVNTAANTIISDLLGYANTNYNTGVQNGTLDTLYTTSVGGDSQWAFKPLGEALTEMQAAKVPYPIGTPPTALVIGQDDFSTTAANLTTTTPDVGIDWQQFGDTGVWSTASGIASRTANNDTTGALAIVGTTYQSNVVVGVDWRSTLASNYPVAQPLEVGVLARVDGASYVQAGVTYNTTPVGGAYFVRKFIAGAPGVFTDLALIPVAPNYFAAGTWFTIRFLADELGNWTLWHYNQATGFLPDGATAPVAYGNDPDLATGGALDSGNIGMFDCYTNTGGSIQRDYDNFIAATYTGPQSFDFELAPIEPTSAPVKIANLNVRTQIGTSKPEVIFEHGTGNRSVKSYRRVTDRKGLLNQAYSLPASFPTDIDVRVGDDPVSRAARGLFQETVPSDVQDSQLRQALVDAHVRIRGVPRQIITFEPSETAPVFGTDYIVGDFVTGRALVNGDARFNALFRIYQVEVSIDEQGRETVTPTLVPE